MAAFAILGLLIIGLIFAFGVYWLITNLTFKKQPERYEYVKNEDGTETVKELSEDAET